ncbi:MAG: condensation domain-containing protein, partial [Gammaproteobacteria bacterium]
MRASAATIEFLDQLRIRGVEIWIEGELLRYSAPKGVMNDDVVGELRKRKNEILSHLRTQQQPRDAGTIAAVARDGALPLSFAQQRIWFLDELEPDNPFYNVALAKHIRGPIDVSLLRKSLLQLIQRHEVLRSTCISSDEGPRLRVTPAEDIDPDGDWFATEALQEDTSDTELRERVNAEVAPALPLSS